ncbi:MAG: DUF5104 domain-containing protein [Clostridia bacterium]
MKIKKISLCCLIALMLFSMFLFFGCENYSDEDIAKKNIEKLINVIQEKDREGIKALFAPNKIDDIENFDKRIDDLFNYCQGKYIPSEDEVGAMTEMDKNDGITIKHQIISYDFTTTVEKYRLAVKWYLQDASVAENVGIWSFYIIKFDDDFNKAFRYGGDGLWTSGINIGKARPAHD